MLILPDVRGLHTFYEELALRFAEAGIEALAIATSAGRRRRHPRGRFDHNPQVEQTAYDGSRTSRSARASSLALPDVRAMFSVGFCYGGRLAFLIGARESSGCPAVIGFYGISAARDESTCPRRPTRESRSGTGARPVRWGRRDDTAGPIKTYRRPRSRGVDNDSSRYPGAPHSFFDRKVADYATESADAWERALEFVRPAPG